MKEPLQSSPPKRSERSARDTRAHDVSPLESPVLASRGLTADAFGNRALLSLLRGGAIQRKARVSQPGDPLEHEADRAAEAVVSGAEPVRPVHGAKAGAAQRTETEDEQLAIALGLESEGGRVGAEPPLPPEQPAASPSAIAGRLYGGYGLDERTRESMETQFGESFSDVRIHTGSDAATTADAMHSRAFTVGSDIVFAEGEFAPETTDGRRLLAHELAHVVQQRQPSGPIAGEQDAERDAHEAAHEVTYGGTPAVRERAQPGIIQKDDESRQLPAWPEGFPSENWRNINVDGTKVANVFAPGEPVITVVSTSATEYGKDFSKLSVAVAVVEPADYVKMKQTRWPSEGVHVSISQVPLPSEPPEPAPPQPAPTPPVKPKVVPPKQPAPPPSKTRPAPKTPPAAQPPQAAEPQPAEPQPGAAAKTEDSPATKLREALATDSSKVPEAAGKLSDREMAELDHEDRVKVIDAIAKNGTSTDLAVMTRLIHNTPDSDAGALSDALEADNGKLLREFYPKIGVNGTVQLSFATMDLSVRRTDRAAYSLLELPQTAPPELNLANLFKEGPRDPSEIIYVGDKSMQPSWLKGAKYWKDAKGNTNFMSPELGLTTWSPYGKRLNDPPPGYYEAARAVRGSMYLAQTGGRRYVEGKGWLDEAGWKTHLQEVADNYTAEQGREFANLKGFQEEWDKTQANAAPAPKYLSHLLGGRSLDDPAKIVDRTGKDLDIGRNEILKARTPEELAEAMRYANGITSYGQYQFGQYREDVYLGGDRTITGIKVAAVATTAYVSAPVLLAGGGAAVTVKGVAFGAGLGGTFSATRQGVEILQGTRNEFSLGEVGEGAVVGGLLVFVPEAAPLMLGMGVQSGADELSQGHYGTAAFDLGSSVLGAGAKGAPQAWRYAKPRIAAGLMRVTMGTEMGMGRGVYPGGIPLEPQIVLVDSAGRPVSSGTRSSGSTGFEQPGTTSGTTPRSTSKGSSVVDPIDAAFSPDAAYDVGPLTQLNRVRTTRSGKQLVSMDDVQLTPQQRAAAKEVHGQKMAQAQQAAWENAADPHDVAEVQRLWNEGTPQSQNQARALAREAFNRHRGRYWRAVQKNPALRSAFEDAGMRFKGGDTTAPVYELSDGSVARMTLEHSTRLTDNPARALRGDNLQFVLGDENSFYLEALRRGEW